MKFLENQRVGYFFPLVVLNIQKCEKVHSTKEEKNIFPPPKKFPVLGKVHLSEKVERKFGERREMAHQEIVEIS